MATGDENDFINRISAVLPPWFGADITPVLTALLSAFAEAGSLIYSQEEYVQDQTRITTATDTNLDLIAEDFFGVSGLLRQPNENDATYQAQILANILRPRATRASIISIVEEITGMTPSFFEPMRPADTGGYGTADSFVGNGFAYNTAGGWGSTKLPYQAFLIATVPANTQTGALSGWGNSFGGWGTPSALSWSAPNTINNFAATQVYEAVANTQVEGTIIWVGIIFQ